ncbi:DUF1549 and DUF1553 domain-containing protein [Aeoliella sp. ICT_H6.2]|uniref:DUF1549 and DUF1553 domain-containing protein n=1 Tax=Aeoliella straminimaris TaxID=2954799 RepID=A0A9X2FDI3_9BACT|nr:DUF1549 domain-containing protein [Aeoliella straminimaris]MCO6042301.1 DUF1549 and DUF1553 domain-containing protein [Aeoliella straminimaris]
MNSRVPAYSIVICLSIFSAAVVDAAGSTDPDAMAARVDEMLAAEWTQAGITPATAATDSEFIRRVYLDLVGVVPRVSQVREFLDDDSPTKRIDLVERLLRSPRYATHMATTWRNRIVPPEVEQANMRESVALEKWLRERFESNLRYDNIVGGLLATGGDELGPALYFRANDFAPEKLAASTSELFLGVKLECAQCHDHPFADWKQRDFWGLAAFFARIDGSEAMQMNANLQVRDKDSGEVMLPDTTEVIPPKFPGGPVVEDSDRRSRRVQLTIWMTERDNRLFSRAAVNWSWTHLFGQPLVTDIDLPREQQSSIHADLLDELADYFVATQFDLANLWRVLASTQAYGLSGEHPAPPDPHYFAVMQPKPLTPEQFYDSVALLSPTMSGSMFPSTGDQLTEDPVRAEFVRRMRSPSEDPLEYHAGTLQALLLMNGPTTTGLTDHQQGRLLTALTAPYMRSGDQVTTLFLATLAREPDSLERESCETMLQDTEGDEQRMRALSDLLWALVNSTEFAFRR